MKFLTALAALAFLGYGFTHPGHRIEPEPAPAIQSPVDDPHWNEDWNKLLVPDGPDTLPGPALPPGTIRHYPDLLSHLGPDWLTGPCGHWRSEAQIRVEGPCLIV